MIRIAVASMDDSDNRWIVEPEKLQNESDFSTWQYMLKMNFESNERAYLIFNEKLHILAQDDGTVTARDEGSVTAITGARYFFELKQP